MSVYLRRGVSRFKAVHYRYPCGVSGLKRSSDQAGGSLLPKNKISDQKKAYRLNRQEVLLVKGQRLGMCAIIRHGQKLGDNKRNSGTGFRSLSILSLSGGQKREGKRIKSIHYIVQVTFLPEIKKGKVHSLLHAFSMFNQHFDLR